MANLEISPNFTNDDIHRIREYNYEITRDFTFEQQKDYYKKAADETMRKIEEIRRKTQTPA